MRERGRTSSLVFNPHPSLGEESRVGGELLALLKRRTGRQGLRYAQAPSRMRRGFSAKVYGFRLADAPLELAGDLVLRLMPDGEPFRRGLVMQAALERLGFPTPRIRMSGDREAGLGTPFIIMDRARGDCVHKVTRTPALLADAMAALHSLAPWPVLEALAQAGLRRESVGLDAVLAELAEAVGKLPLRGFRPGLEWLHRNRLRTERLVVCHGDINATNILAEEGRLTAVVDWTDARITGPAYDVGSTSALLSQTRVLGLRLSRGFRDAYRRHNPLGEEAILWHEALYCLRVLATVAACRLRGGTPAAILPWEIAARGYAAHFRRITGIGVGLPRAGKIMVKLLAPLVFVQI